MFFTLWGISLENRQNNNVFKLLLEDDTLFDLILVILSLNSILPIFVITNQLGYFSFFKS